MNTEIFKTLIDIAKIDNIRYLLELDSYNKNNLIYQKAKEKGFRVLGTGLYSIVVEHLGIPDRVFKISTVPTDGYRGYAQYCLENAGTRFLPIIHDYKEISKFAFYELDKLHPITISGSEEFINLKLESMYYHAHAGLYAKHCDVIDAGRDENEIFKLMMHIRSTFPMYTPDLHTENLMINTISDIFITDPLGGYSSGESW